jgi:putative SOS response-associated peptidase YedK
MMCGRFTVRSNLKKVAEEFDLSDVPVHEPRYNIAPTQDVAVVRFDRHTGTRRLDLLRWGLVPFWADDPKIGNRLINARSESAADKPAFKHSMRAKRCLVVADGFYEWRKRNGAKQPYLIRLKDDRPFGFAGLWDRWDKNGDPIESCTILTTDANDLLAPLHDRMPVIIPRSAYGLWLDPAVTDPDMLRPLLVPFPSGEMEAYPVSTVVNSAKNELVECMQRVGWF